MNIHDVINGYELISEILGGGMAQVFVVEKGGKKYALKTPKPNSSDEFVKRFKREVRIMKDLRHDSILEVIDYDIDIDEPYYIMPLCESTLDNEIPRMSSANRLQACIDFTIGIKALHKSGIRHRDIKPANALILNGQLKISDLGLGRFANRDTTTMTTTMGAMGTYGYIPPEYYNNPAVFRDGTIEGDIFMLGKSIYVICSGGDNPAFVDSSKLAPSIYAIVDRCTKIKPEERYHDATEVLNDLMDVQRQQRILSLQPLPIEKIQENKHLIDFENQVFRLLMSIGNDNTEMDRVLRKLSTNDLYRVFRVNKAVLPDFIKYFVGAIRNAKYSIQFTELDEYARIGKILIELCDDVNSNQLMLQFLIEYAKGYNRYYAMEVVGDILADMNDETVRKFASFLKKYQDDLISIKPSFKVSHHGYVRDVLERKV